MFRRAFVKKFMSPNAALEESFRNPCILLNINNFGDINSFAFYPWVVSTLYTPSSLQKRKIHSREREGCS